MSPKSLWGNLDEFKKIKTPLSIVREQGALLTQETKGILRGEVKINATGENISFSFFIIAMQLNRYKYLALQVEHDVFIYPVKVYSGIHEKWTECRDEASFLARIESILSSLEMKTIIESLLSQSES